MEKMDYLKILVEKIHSVTVATLGLDGRPQTRITAFIAEDVPRSARNSALKREVNNVF